MKLEQQTDVQLAAHLRAVLKEVDSRTLILDSYKGILRTVANHVERTAVYRMAGVSTEEGA